MDQMIVKVFCLDGDTCEVLFRYDKTCEKYFGEYPDFEEAPRYTKNGWPWVTAIQEGCIHSVNKYVKDDPCMDCGSCEYFVQEQEHDLVGICSNENKRRCGRHRTERTAESRLNS